MEFYIIKKKPHLGPYSITELDELLQEEEITGEDYYWHAGMEAWLPLAKFPGYIPPPDSPPPPPERIFRQLPTPAAAKPMGLPAPAEPKPLDPPAGAPQPLDLLATIPKTDNPPAPAVKKPLDLPAPAPKPINLEETARLRPDEKAAHQGKKPPAKKNAPTEKLPRLEARSTARLSPLRVEVPWQPIIVGMLCLLLLAGGYLIFRHFSKEPEIAQSNLPRKISTIEEARSFVSGTWTYIGNDSPAAAGKATLWEKFVIRPDGSIDMYSALSGDKDWGTPTTESYRIVTGRVAGSGARVFGIQVANYDMKIVITARGTLRETTADRDVEFFRGDRNPFSK